MIKLYITLIILLIICVQISQRKLLTSSTVWVGCYYCYFVIAPILLNDKNVIVDQFALKGICSFGVGYLIVYMAKGFFLVKTKKKIKFAGRKYDVERLGIVYDYMLSLTILALTLTLGKEGIIKFFSGQLAAKDYLIIREGFFAELYSFLIGFLGYMLLYLFVRNYGEIDKKFITRVLIYTFIVFFFSFTRATIILLLAALFLYKIRKENTVKQIFIMSILVLGGTIAMIVMGYVRTHGIRDGFNNVSVTRMMHDLAGSIDFTIPYMDFQREIESDVEVSTLVYLKPIFMFIPRAIWSDKPLASTIQILKAIDPSAMERGYSTGFTILGEGYAVWGEKGIIILPFIWSIVCALLDEHYIRKIREGTDNDYSTCGYIIFTAYMVVQCHRQGTDAVMVYFIMAMLWLWLCSRIKLLGIRLGIKFTIARQDNRGN